MGEGSNCKNRGSSVFNYSQIVFVSGGYSPSPHVLMYSMLPLTPNLVFIGTYHSEIIKASIPKITLRIVFQNTLFQTLIPPLSGIIILFFVSDIIGKHPWDLIGQRIWFQLGGEVQWTRQFEFWVAFEVEVGDPSQGFRKEKGQI